MNRFDGKRVVVAAGGSGIGAATSERLAREGAKVVVGDINEDGARATVERITAAGGTAQAMKFDLADEASTDALIRKCVDLYGGIDGLANIGADLSPETMAGDRSDEHTSALKSLLRISYDVYCLKKKMKKA